MLTRRKGTIGIVVLVILLAALAGSVSAKTPIQMWLPASSLAGIPEVVAWFEAFEDNFNANNPDIDLEVRLVAGGVANLNEAIAIGVASGVGPDISYSSSNILARMTHGGTHAGLARPITRYVDAWAGRDDILPDILNALEYRGEMYGVPFALWPIFDVYNVDLFSQGGVALPDTWDEQVAAARALSRMGSDGNLEVAGYKAGLTGDTYAFYRFGLAMEQLGAPPIEHDANVGSINNDRGRRALDYLAQLVDAGMAGLNAAIPHETTGNVAAFASDGTQTRNLSLIQDSGIELALRRYVGPDPGTDMVMHNAAVLFMLSSTRHPDEAWRVMEAFLEAQNLKGYYMADGRFQPVRLSMMNDRDILERPFAQEQISLLVPPITTYGTRHPLLTEFHSRVGEYIVRVLRGEIAQTTALEEGERIMNVMVRDFE